MYTLKLFLVFSICIGISQSQYYYDDKNYDEDYGDDYREREKISFKTVPSKFYFQTVLFLNCSCDFTCNRKKKWDQRTVCKSS